MSVILTVHAPYSGDVEVSTPIDYSITSDREGIENALIDAVRKVVRMYGLEVVINKGDPD